MTYQPNGLVHLVLAALVTASAACTDDPEDPPTSTTSTQASSEPAAGATIETIETPRGIATIDLNGDTYTATINNCVIDPTDGSVDILGTGSTEAGPIRVEYGVATGQQLGLFIDVQSAVDPGTSTWIGSPDFMVTENRAVADAFTMTESNSNESASATATIECDSP